MKRMPAILSLVIALAIGLAPAASAAQAKPIVVVFDIATKRIKLDKVLLDGLCDHLATLLTRTGAYQVVPRSELKSRLTQQKKETYKECYDQSCQVELGRELAAEKTVSTQILKLGEQCTVNLTLYDLGKAATEKGASQRGGCTEDHIALTLEQAVAELVGQATRSAQPTVAAAVPGAKLGAARLVSNIEGTEVFIDGEKKGAAPLTVSSLVAGDHLARFEAGGYHPKQATFTVRDGEQSLVMVELKRIEAKKSLSDRFKSGLDTALEVGHEAFGEAKESAQVVGAKAKELKEDGGDTASDDVAAPKGGLIYKRCPLGQTWREDGCQGQIQELTFYKARGACPKGYRLPQAAELFALLGDCAPSVGQGQAGDCQPCAGVEGCAAMFGPDRNRYWTFSWHPKSGRVRTVSFDGQVDEDKPEQQHPVRCVRK